MANHALAYRCGGSTRWHRLAFQPAFASCFPFNCRPVTAREHQNVATVKDGLPLRQRKSSASLVAFGRAGVMH